MKHTTTRRCAGLAPDGKRCKATFEPPAQAPHKRFHSSACKARFVNRANREGRAEANKRIAALLGSGRGPRG